MRRLCGTVLAMEAVILLLAIVPAKVLGHASGGTAAAVCGGLAVVALVLSDDAIGGVGLGSTAVLVTGSVVTAGDAQLLLAPGSAVGTSSNAGYAGKWPTPSKQGDPA